MKNIMLPVYGCLLVGSSLSQGILYATPKDDASPAKETPALARENLSPRIAGERKTVDLTVYNSNLALVREERTMTLGKGSNRVQVPEIPATIDPTSLHFSSLTDPTGVRVLEQNYQYDL